jgi:hypothetical protein
MRFKTLFLILPWMGCLAAACSGSQGDGPGFGDTPGATDAAASSAPDADAGGTSSFSSSGGGDDGGFVFTGSTDAQASDASGGACSAGHYSGTFSGNYSSNLIVGIPLAVTGNVDLTLNQGNPQTTCNVSGEFESCSNFYPIEGGTVTGVANQTQIGEAGIGGYPYFCVMTGTLDCKRKTLVGGWLQCTYCVTTLSDGGAGCAPLIGGLGSGIGGHFAGPVTASYDTGTHSFVLGTWNGAEALAGNDGGAAGPDGGPISSFLALDGGYGVGDYGGSGSWGASHQ